MATIISGGVASGGLHAVSGPDHLAALLPKCVGQRWYRAGWIGAYWGFGHGISAMIVGMAAFFLKNKITARSAGLLSKSFLTSAELVMNLAVGLSLIAIGLFGIKEAKEWGRDVKENGNAKSLSSAVVCEPLVKGGRLKKRTILFNGVLHGFSWDGAPSLAGSVAVATWKGNIFFLLSYGLGTIGAMSLATMLIGEGTNRLGEKFSRPDVPQKISLYSSFLAIAIGVVWTLVGLKR